MFFVLTAFFLILFLGLTALFSASETAFFSLSTFTVKNYKTTKDPRKRLVAGLLTRPRELLVTIIIGNVFCNILIQNTVSGILGPFSSWLVKVGTPLFLTLFIGEIIPKSIALPFNKEITYRVAPVLSFFSRWLGPVRIVLTTCTSYISRFFFFFLPRQKPISEEELHFMLETSEALGVLSKQELLWIDGYLLWQNLLVKEQMRPVREILFFDIQEKSLDSLLTLFVDRKCSRIPVCNGSLDNLLGIISAHVFFAYQERIQTPEDLKNFLKKPFFVPESSLLGTLLVQMRSKKVNLAMVVDEYGSISGLITQEDLVEPIIGKIFDVREKTHYTQSSENEIIADGTLELKEFEEIFHQRLESETNMVTLGGWLMEQLGEIPPVGTKWETGDFLFYVIAAEPNRISRIYVRRLKLLKRVR